MTGALVTLGETMAVVSARGPLRSGATATLRVAGAESNVAIGVARLGHPARWLGRLGADEPGEMVLRVLRAEGLDVAAVVRDPSAPTGLMVKERRLGTVARVHYYRTGSAGARLDAGDVTPSLLEGAAIVHVTGITAALGEPPRRALAALLSGAQARAIPVSFDVNHRARLWPDDAAAAGALAPLARASRIVFGDSAELALVSGGRGPRALLDAGVEVVVVKLGSDGAEAWTADGVVRQEAAAVEAVDTVGAGDALCAGYLSGYLDGLDAAAALARAVRVAGFAVAADGDWEGLPSQEELELLDLPGGSTLR